MPSTLKFKSPKGALEWVTISGEGKENLSGKLQYVANVVISEDDPVIAKIEEFWKDNKPKGFKKPAKSNGVYPHKTRSEDSDEYEEDGDYYLAFKTGTTYPDGSTKKVQVYNAKAAKVELPESTSIGNGSIGIISGTMGIYTTKSKAGAIIDAGVTLYLDAIQLLRLEEFTQDAGFEADEDGDWTGDEGWEGAEESTTTTPAKGSPRL